MRILMVTSYGYWGDFDPRAAYREVEGADTQIGGGETAMVNIAHELAARGHEVMVFYGNVSGEYDGVDYLQQHYAVAIANELWHDVLVAWDAMDAFRFYSRSGVRIGAFQLNDAQVGVYDHMVDLYMCPSKWHAHRFQGLYPELTASKFRPTTTNGVSPSLYAHEVARQPHKVIHSSSPDRGLHHLLAVWPEVKTAVPDAELHVFYGLDRWFRMLEQCMQRGLRASTEPRYHELKHLLGELNRLGIAPVLHDGVSKAVLAKAQLSAHVLAYPCDPVQPTEGFSMTCLEGLMAGCYLLTTDADALGELWTEFTCSPDDHEEEGPAQLMATPPTLDTLTSNLVNLLRRDPPPDGPSKDPRLAKYFWPTLAETWEREVEKCLTSK